MLKRPFIFGFLGTLGLLILYFSLLSLLSGWIFAQAQFFQFRYFIITLALGFGIQVGLYAYLRSLVKGGGKVLGVTGTTSTAAMISCCAHYLANILPILGIVGVVSFIAQYQVELFWVGVIFNLGGVIYMVYKVSKFKCQ